MITPQELLRVLLAPLVASAIIAFIARWRRWPWLTPIAMGIAFMIGYALLGVPKFPPADGSDWLFWAAIPLTGLGMLAGVLRLKWAAWCGLAAGAVVLTVIYPLVPGTLDLPHALGAAAGFGIAGAVLMNGLIFSESKIGPLAILVTLWLVLSGAAVIVMSSNFRVGGLYGIAAAAATAGLIAARPATARGVMVIGLGLLAGLLACGHYYPDPGLTWANWAVVFASPLLLAGAAALPIQRRWVRAAIGIIAVALVVAAVAVPAAIAAQHAAEQDPYAATS